MNRGDVVLFVAQGDIGKPRPGVIVQANELGDATTSVIICPMTSDLHELRQTRPVIQPSGQNRLHAPSQIMTDKLLALRRDRIRIVIGSIDSETTDQLDGALMLVLGLAK